MSNVFMRLVRPATGSSITIEATEDHEENLAMGMSLQEELGGDSHDGPMGFMLEQKYYKQTELPLYKWLQEQIKNGDLPLDTSE